MGKVKPPRTGREISARRSAERRGRQAEDLVAAFYVQHGFTVLGHRVRNARGEIDLVVADKETIAFVEVKARATICAAAEAVTRRQQQRLAGAAEAVLAQHDDWRRDYTRFDVVLMINDHIIPLTDAFRPGDIF